VLAGTLTGAAGPSGDSARAVAPAPARALETAIIPNPIGLSEENQDLQFARIRAAGATAVRLEARWSTIAPNRRPGFDPTNPGDPAYRWLGLDNAVRRARAHDLEPILLVFSAPGWAQAKRPRGSRRRRHDGPYKPSPAAFGQFATALARRYSGSFEDLPRVRAFIAWNEPNIYRYLTPQRVRGRLFSPLWYRRMVNEFASAIHGVHADNLVVAGALLFNGAGDRISPMPFMRKMLCMSQRMRKNGKRGRPHPACRARVAFDVWSHHPYSRGDPFHHASNPDDVMIGDLGRMRALLKAAVTARHVVSKRRIEFWVDEFSYDSRPPDRSRDAVPLGLHARWVSESLYQMWRAGVSLATWFLLRDEPVRRPKPGGYGQSGLYRNRRLTEELHMDRPKPALTAFRFPFVAYRRGGRVIVWGRTPTSQSGRVAIEVARKGKWTKLKTLRAGSRGIFTRRFRYRGRANAKLRARFEARTSRSFSLRRPRDRFVLAFG
jgi:hypothetical protein